MKRRQFLKVLGLGGAGAGVSACGGEPTYNLIPYLVDEENIVPGVATYYASVCGECPAGCGVHVKTREGRPIKMEGNPEHPVNSGALCARGQASLQGLYNPDRVTGPMRRAQGSTDFSPLSWDDAQAALAARIRGLVASGRPDRVYLMTDGAVGSLDSFFDRWMAAVGSPNRIIYDSFDLEPLRAANRIAFGIDGIPHYDPGAADLIVSFGAEFLSSWIAPTGFARSWSRPENSDGRKARYVFIAPRLSIDGSNADEWLQAEPGSGVLLALAMARAIVDAGLDEERGSGLASTLNPYTVERAAQASGVPAETIERVARELAQAPAALVLPPGIETGGTAATAEHVAVNLLNHVAGAVGTTVRFGPNTRRRHSAGLPRLRELVSAMRAGEVDVLLVHGIDPVYTLPAGLGFADALENVGLAVSFSSYMDETAAASNLILPDSTPLESWGDSQPRVGVYGLRQPAMDPLFDTRSTPDVLISVAGALGGNAASAITWPDFRAYLQDQWRVIQNQFAPGASFESFWRESLKRGGAWREIDALPVELDSGVTSYRFATGDLEGEGDLTLLVYPSLKFYDGRFANRPWLQEMPDPMTKAVWNSWVEIGPELAGEMGVETGEMVRVTSSVGSLEAPAFVYRGIGPSAVAVPTGQGHEHLGRYARHRGANPMAILPAAADAESGGLAYLAARVTVEPTGVRGQLVTVQSTDTDHDREIAEVIGLEAARQEEEHAAQEMRADPGALVHTAEDADPKSPYRWGMAVDTSSCIGCSACVAACYAENNVPVVGEEVVAQGREMSWIRVESYYEHVLSGEGHNGAGGGSEGEGQADHEHAAGDFDAVAHVPVMCQHCGNAPCEPVCPVYATYHNPEGLNVQVYNRCVGTRYCSNNCPYKVRRFEFFQYEWAYPLNLQLNPDVTVREKGVMEKCTFCVQRISLAKSEASAEGRLVQDGEVVPACAATCPTDAIVFGNLRDPNSRVSQLARGGRSYHMLGELNTRPAVTYLKKVVRVGEED